MNYQARLGAFVLVALLMLGLLGSRIGHVNWTNPQGLSAEILMNDAAGIAVQTPVLMAGVRVGHVKSIDLQGNRALVRLQIKQGIILPASTRAALMGGGLVGEKYLALHANPGDHTPLDIGKRIPFEQGGNLNILMSKAASIAGDIRRLADTGNQTIQTLSSMLDNNRDDVRHTVKELGETSHLLKQKLSPVLSHLQSTTEQIDRLIRKHRKDMDKTLAILPRALSKGEALLAHGQQNLAHIDAVLMENRENIYRMIFEFRKAAEHLEALSDDLRRNPWKLMNKQKEVRPSRRMQQEKMEEILLHTGKMGVAPARQ